MVVKRTRVCPSPSSITYRPQFGPPWSGHAHVTALQLNRLGRRQGAAMALQVRGGKALPADPGPDPERTDGVPLFVEELAGPAESGLLTDVGDRYELLRPLPPLAIPANLADSLMAWLDRLAPSRSLTRSAARPRVLPRAPRRSR